MNFSISALETVELRTPAASFFFILLKKPFSYKKELVFIFQRMIPGGQANCRSGSFQVYLFFTCYALHCIDYWLLFIFLR